MSTYDDWELSHVFRRNPGRMEKLLFFLLFPPYRILERILVGTAKDIPLLNRCLYTIESLRLRPAGHLKMLLSKLDPLPTSMTSILVSPADSFTKDEKYHLHHGFVFKSK